MSDMLASPTARLGPRPRMTLVVQDRMIAEIWVEGRAPLITVHDYDWGETDPASAFDAEGFAFSPINWRRPAWMLGLSLHPPEKETYTMANQHLKTIPLTALKVSKLNVRHGRKKPDISDLLPSIREHGLRQTLLVRQEGKQFGVVAGRRRLFALKQIAKETGIAMKVPCIVMQAGDDAAAIEASIIENAARLPATEMQQYVAFNKLSEKGRSVPEIAEYFGITKLAVRRILALANLAAPIRTLFADGDIDRSTAQALTLASNEQQAEWLRLYESESERAPIGRNCKAWVAGGSVITTDKALFDVATFEGETIADLFGEQGVFANVDDFWAAQSAAISARIETYTQAGWSDVCVLKRGQYFQSWDHTKRARTKGGKVFVEVRHDGSVTFHEGYISNAEARRMEKKKAKGGSASAPKRPEMTKAMADYLFEHRRIAAAASTLTKPALALRLAAAHMLVGSSLWCQRPHQPRIKNEAVADSLAGARGTAEVAAARARTTEMLSAHGLGSVRHNSDARQLCEVFVALIGMDDEEVLHIMTTTMIGSLEAGSPIVEALAVATEADMSAYWKPDQVFFELLRDKRAINAMIGDIATDKLAETSLTETAKAQKQVLINRIDGNGCDPSPDWRPSWMQVPPSSMVSDASSPIADQWERINALFEPIVYDGASGEEETHPSSIAA